MKQLLSLIVIWTIGLDATLSHGIHHPITNGLSMVNKLQLLYGTQHQTLVVPLKN